MGDFVQFGLDQWGKRLRHALDHLVPIAVGFLAEQPHGRIPRRILALAQPSPIGIELEQGPDRAAQTASDVRDRGVGADDEIQILHDRRSVDHVVGTCIVVRPQGHNLHPVGQGV